MKNHPCIVLEPNILVTGSNIEVLECERFFRNNLDTGLNNQEEKHDISNVCIDNVKENY